MQRVFELGRLLVRLPAPLADRIHIHRLPDYRNKTQRDFTKQHQRGVVISAFVRHFRRQAVMDFVNRLFELTAAAIDAFIQLPETVIGFAVLLGN